MERNSTLLGNYIKGTGFIIIFTSCIPKHANNEKQTHTTYKK